MLISRATPVSRAQAHLDSVSSQWVEIGKEAGLLVASSHPAGGQVVDGISFATNFDAGNYGAALVNAIGFVPIAGDGIKALVRGNSIKNRMERINDALAAARTGVSRAQTFARRRMAAAQQWAGIKRRRDEIIDRYRNCRTASCADERDDLLRQQSRLPAKDKGDWVDENGNRVPAGQGLFKPKEGTPMHRALSDHQDPVRGIPYTDGKPDLTSFPPLGRTNRAPDGSAYQVEIEQSLGTNKSANRSADLDASWGQWREDYPDAGRDPEFGQWHHEPDGVTMTYVDKDVHGALAHEGAASLNTSPEF
ncbi:HNH endonuclease [Yoonia sp. 2307UL14-13]|uniref:HNH endonuclease n=1 Tax=Yoonia sp. 2307UL14-13 TaxID=3126506 RepID=UPI0030B5B184